VTSLPWGSISVATGRSSLTFKCPLLVKKIYIVRPVPSAFGRACRDLMCHQWDAQCRTLDQPHRNQFPGSKGAK
jgi:hypothetical protein